VANSTAASAAASTISLSSPKPDSMSAARASNASLASGPLALMATCWPWRTSRLNRLLMLLASAGPSCSVIFRKVT